MRPYKNLPSYVENMILRLEFDIYDIITNAKIAFLAPIDVDKILQYYNVTVQESVSLPKGVDGEVYTDTKIIKISNNIIYPHRRRFVKSHEFGHIFYDTKQKTHAKHHYDGITTQGTDPEEIYANAFASTLLVPIQLLIEQIKITKNINTIAEVFQVSPSVIKYRIQRFCLENVEDNV